jgi:hypothetical protein
VGVQEVRWEKVGTEQAEDDTLFYGERNEDHQNRYFVVHKRIISVVRRAEFINDKTYIILRGHWCNIIVLNVCIPFEDKSDDIKDCFYEELGCVFIQFPK